MDFFASISTVVFCFCFGENPWADRISPPPSYGERAKVGSRYGVKIISSHFHIIDILGEPLTPLGPNLFPKTWHYSEHIPNLNQAKIGVPRHEIPTGTAALGPTRSSSDGNGLGPTGGERRAKKRHLIGVAGTALGPLSAVTVTYYFRAGVPSEARLFHKGGSREQRVLFKYEASCLCFDFPPECPKCITIWNISIFLKTMIENR